MGRASAGEIFAVSEQNLRSHDFSCATSCDVSRIWLLSRCLSVCPSHSATVKTVQAGIMSIFTVSCHKLDSSVRILETVQDSAKVTINQL